MVALRLGATATTIVRSIAFVFAAALACSPGLVAQSDAYKMAISPDRWNAEADTLEWLHIPIARDRELENREAYAARSWRLNYPYWAYDQIRWTQTEQDYDLTDGINPFLMYGDFDGDGQVDVAAWARRRVGASPPGEHHELAVVVVHRAGGVHVIPHAYPHLSIWMLHAEREVSQGVAEGPPPALVGHAIRFIKDGSSSHIQYWDGEAYQEYWQGD